MFVFYVSSLTGLKTKIQRHFYINIDTLFSPKIPKLASKMQLEQLEKEYAVEKVFSLQALFGGCSESFCRFP